MRQEITTTRFNGYFITAYWGPRAQTPAELAKRFFRMIDSFRRIDPIFSPWVYGRNTELETLRGDFAESIAKNIQRDDFGEVTPDGGYWFHAGTEGQPRDRRFSVFCHVGMNLSGVTRNTVILKGSALVNPRRRRTATRSFTRRSSPSSMHGRRTRSRRIAAGSLLGRKLIFRSVRHGCAIFAPNSPGGPCRPPSASAEHLPNGGLLVLATKDTFDVDNPRHVAGAEEIAAALAKLDHPRKSSEA